MKQKIGIYLVASLLFLLVINGQQLEKQVIGSAGLHLNASATIGEVHVSSVNLQVLAGFQQPSFLSGPSLGTKDITKKLTVFPVPTRDELTVKGPHLLAISTATFLYTLEGKEINIPTTVLDGEVKLDLSQIPSGHYFLLIQDKQNQTTATLKIVKIN